MHRILIGRYIPGQSILHRLDPRSKLFFSLFFLLLIFQMDTVWVVCIIQIFLTLIIQFSGISYRFFWGNIRPFFWFAIFLALFQILMVQEGVVLFSVISWEITSKGLWLGGLLFLRFLDMLLITALLTLTTTPMEITHAVSKLLKPLNRFHIPVDTISFMVSLTLRFIPTFLDEAEVLLKAQASRGMDFQEGTLVQKIKGIASIVVPLLIQMFKKADTVALALETRGFQKSGTRSTYRELIWKKQDTGCMLFLFFFYGLLWFF